MQYRSLLKIVAIDFSNRVSISIMQQGNLFHITLLQFLQHLVI